MNKKQLLVFIIVMLIAPVVLMANDTDVFTIEQLLRDGFNRAGEEVAVWGTVSDIRSNSSGEIQSFHIRDGRFSASIQYSGSIPDDLFSNGDAVIVRFELSNYRDNSNSILLGKWGANFNPEYNLVAVDVDKPVMWDVSQRRQLPFDITVEQYALEAYRYGNELVRLTGRIRSKEVANMFGGQERNLYLQFSSPGQNTQVHFWERYWPEEWEEGVINEQIDVGTLVRVTGHFNEETSIGLSFLATKFEVIE